jgi:creatinine amidohydrolase
MAADSSTLLITELTWAEVRDHLDQDRRLLVPCGACDQYGLHLPIGAATLVADVFARRLSDELRILRAPPIPFGVNVPSEAGFAGAASLREKTLHALLNDLLSGWEDDGFTEFILLTAHGYDAHVEAIATATGTRARVRVIELLNLNLGEFLAGGWGPEHGGEALTSLLLYLYPGRVRMDRAVDFRPADPEISTLKQVPKIRIDSPGSLGHPSLATAATGQRLFEHIYERIRTRIFGDTDPY